MQAETLIDRDWLTARVTAMIEDEDDLDPDENLVFYGLDSISVMALAGELKERGIALNFEELAREPTLNGWWALIEARQAA